MSTKALPILRGSFGSGEFKFLKNRITEEDLVEQAAVWKKGSDGERYKVLYVRQCSASELCIGFLYELPNGLQATWNEFRGKRIDEVVEKFVPAKFGGAYVGFSLSCPTWVIE